MQNCSRGNQPVPLTRCIERFNVVAAKRQGSSVVEQPRKHSGLVASGHLHYIFDGYCQGSSVVEQGTHKPLVGSSILPPGTSSKWPGFTFLKVRPEGIISVRLLTCGRDLLNTSEGIRIQQNRSARRLKLSQVKNSPRLRKRGESREY
jgi:hypothetical protein